MKPVDVKPFLEDEKIQEIIESTKVKVEVDDQTEDGLVGRNGRIEGLNPNKYYLIEKELNAGGFPVNTDVYPLYVTDFTGPGGLIDDLSLITRISGGNINGLTNSNTYTVRAAAEFTNTKFTFNADAGNVEILVSNGAISIDAAGTVTLEQLSPQYDGYDVMAVAVIPDNLKPFSGDKKTISASTTSFQLEGVGTTVDYVFVKTAAPLDFKVLRVMIKQPPVTGIRLTVTFTITDAMGNSSVTGGTTISRGTFNGGSTLTLALGAPIGGGSWSGITWSVSGLSDTTVASHVNTSNALVIDNTSDFWDVLAAPSFEVAVTAALSGVPYSTAVTITVTN
jgi:hypothetical protein